MTQSSLTIEALLERSETELAQALGLQLQELIGTYPDRMAQSGKGRLRYIHISLLRSSVADKFPLYRIDCYDEKGPLDLVEHCGYWHLGAVSEAVYALHPEPTNPVDRLQSDWERKREENLMREAETLHQLMEGYIQRIAEKASQFHVEYLQGVEMYFGEYFGKTNRILSWKGQ